MTLRVKITKEEIQPLVESGVKKDAIRAAIAMAMDKGQQDMQGVLNREREIWLSLVQKYEIDNTINNLSIVQDENDNLFIVDTTEVEGNGETDAG